MTEQSESPGRTDGRVPPAARPTGDAAHPRLSPLDVEILRRMAQGESLTEISHEVGVSRSLLLRRAQRLMTSLGARDREELAAKAKEKGLI